MCLACEMDAMWFAEMEAAAARASSLLPNEERSKASARETAGEGSLSDRSGESPAPGARSLSSGPPEAGPAGATDLSPTGRGDAPQRGDLKTCFACEETRSE